MCCHGDGEAEHVVPLKKSKARQHSMMSKGWELILKIRLVIYSYLGVTTVVSLISGLDMALCSTSEISVYVI